MAKRWWSIEEVSRGVHKLRIDLLGGNVVRDVLWISDLHWDNPKCDRDALRRDLDAAVERDAPIIVVGDFFCAMQGKWDKRASKEDLRPEHQTGAYLDALVSTALEWFEPYKNHLALVTSGNHESAIYKVHETDLLDRFAGGMRQAGGVTLAGGYQGWVKKQLQLTSTVRKSWNFFYWHGGGGGAPVTKGQIDYNRLSEFVVADAFISGHIHRRNLNDQLLMRLNDACKQELVERDYVRLSTYKQEGDQTDGWAVERKMGPRPIGGYWCRIGISKRNRRWRAWREWIKTRG